ncbi:hypothetical protein [Ornithinicoccus halotolerans]|uniref:hypothetical protein n=1 Tax=Ornithinicoccus halotolerans TaxID=1748220 RepID=UPI001297357E|nr:hypothetical protein [Ornithinicoccus halotolerans]
MRGRHRARAVAAGLTVAGLLALAAVLTATGLADRFARPADPVAVPEWDSTRDFRFQLGEGTYPRLDVVREAGADRFRVSSTISTATELEGTALASLPGSELFVGPGVTVLLTPAPRGLEDGAHYWLSGPADLGRSAVYGTSRVVEHGSHTLLVQVLVSRHPIRAEDVGDIAWVVDGTVGLASGATVHQADLESGGRRLLVWRAPEQDLVGYVTRDRGPRLWGAGLDRGHLYGVAVREDGEAGRATSRQWRFAVLPAGVREVTAVLDDSVGTVMPFETVPLGSETVAYRLLDGVDVERRASGHWELSWLDAAGVRRDVVEAAAGEGEGAAAPGSAPTLDPTAELDVELAPVESGLAVPVLVRREAAADRFTVLLQRPDGTQPLQPVPGELPGQAQLFSDGELTSVLLTPVSGDVDAEETQLLGTLPGRGTQHTVVTQDGDQRLLAHVFRADAPVRASDVRDVLWVTGDRVVAASGTPVLATELADVGEGGQAFVVPEHQVAGALLPWSALPLQVATTGQPQLLSLAVGSVGPGRTDGARLLLALLPGGASEPRVRLDDRDRTQLRLHTATLGEHTLGSAVVRGVDVATENDQPALSWTSAGGTRRSLAGVHEAPPS